MSLTVINGVDIKNKSRFNLRRFIVNKRNFSGKLLKNEQLIYIRAT